MFVEVLVVVLRRVVSAFAVGVVGFNVVTSTLAALTSLSLCLYDDSQRQETSAVMSIPPFLAEGKTLRCANAVHNGGE